MTKDVCIHTPDDGRGVRHVYLDGRLVDHVFFADIRRGIVKKYRYPFRLDKFKKRILSRTLHGRVDVTEPTRFI